MALVLMLNSVTFGQQYGFRHYGAADGLQNLAILSLAQDGAGYIWAGSEAGLYRYDGTRFHLMAGAEGLPCASEVHTLHVATDGALWANTCDRIFRFDGQRFQPVAGLSGMLTGAQGMANDARGHVLAATPSGLYEMSRGGDGSLSARPYPLGPTLAGTSMRAIARSGSQLWFGCGRRLCVEQGGRVSIFGPAEGLPVDSWDAIGITPDGSVWVRSPSRLYRNPPGASRLVPEKPGLPSNSFWGVLKTGRNGSVVVPTDKGLAILRDGKWNMVDDRHGLHNKMTSAVLEDREGSVWIAQIGAGVARWLGYGEWESWTKAQGLPSDLIWSIRRDRKGALWVGTSLGLARLDARGGPPRTWTRKDGLGGDNVRWLGETSDGSIWAVMKPGSVTRIDPASGNLRRFGPADGLSCSTSHRGFVDHLDRLWIATACGIFRNDKPAASGRFHRIDQPESMEHGAWALAEDRQGTMWITNPDGLWRLSEGRWRQYRKADGLLSDNPYIPVIASDDALWLRHRLDAGVERVEFSQDRIVHVTPIVPVDPLSVDVTAFHGFDAWGRFWRGSADGVSFLAGQPWAGGSWRHLSTEDGLISNDTDGEAFWADPDGSVWIGTSGGLAHYRPPRGAAPGEPMAEAIITGLEIDQKSRVITAGFSSLSYKSEQLVRFEYRLDHAPWIDATERIISVAGLAPGWHKLDIRSRVRDGPFSPRIASATFHVEPKWWETWWFRSAALLLAAAAVWGVVLWRHRLLRRRNRELEQAVHERTAELESERTKVLEEKKRADAASEAKGHFLARMSHEIRTPMNGVVGMAHLLVESELDQEQREWAETVLFSAESLLTVINDILDISKIEAGKLTIVKEPFNLCTAVAESVQITRPRANEKGLRLRFEHSHTGSCDVIGDAARVRQIVVNYLSNAIKFTERGEVVVRAEFEERGDKGSAWLISVTDTGMGIPKEKQESLFGEFVQARSSDSTQFGGTGLGLAICKQLAELMGGKVGLRSEPSKGSTFWARLPLPPATAPARDLHRPRAKHRRRTNEKCLILFADDNRVNQTLGKRMLEKLDCEVDLAGDGSQALELWDKRPYDAIFMDCQMPELDGFQVTQRIRQASERGRAIPIIATTANATPADRQQCLSAGMDDHIGKPLSMADLVRVLDTWAGTRLEHSSPA